MKTLNIDVAGCQPAEAKSKPDCEAELLAEHRVPIRSSTAKKMNGLEVVILIL